MTELEEERVVLQNAGASARGRIVRGACLVVLGAVGLLVGVSWSRLAELRELVLAFGCATVGVVGVFQVIGGSVRAALTARKLRSLATLPEARVLRLPP